MATDRLDRVALILTAGAVGFCLGEWFAPAMVGQRIQWETLVTGILAIAAAAWSVRAAMRVDGEQERRHRQLARLQLRQDTLRLQRAVDPAAGWMMGMVAWGAEALGRYEADRVKGLDPSPEVMDRLTIVAEQAVEAIVSRQIATAEDLFEPSMATRYDVLTALARRVEVAVAELVVARNEPANILYPNMPNSSLTGAVAKLAPPLQGLIGLVPPFVEELEQLLAKYMTDF